MFFSLERIYQDIGKIKFINNKIIKKLGYKKNINPNIDRMGSFIQLIFAIEDASDFYNISIDAFFDNMNKWNATEEKLFEESKSLDEFYESWNGVAALENTCANIFNQMIWYENYNVCAAYAVKSSFMIDYGCGTATLSLGLAIKKKIKRLTLLDVPNDIKSFREHRIRKHSLKNVEQASVFEYQCKEDADLIICIDVLEHLENSSYIFQHKIDPMLKIGGVLILRAPWRGQLTHIAAAADDFYLNGGRNFLSKHYKEVCRFGSNDICCAYQKIR